jgi:hypothetical protein
VHCQIQQFREVIRDHNINRISFMSRHLEISIALFQDGCKSRKRFVWKVVEFKRADAGKLCGGGWWPTANYSQQYPCGDWLNRKAPEGAHWRVNSVKKFHRRYRSLEDGRRRRGNIWRGFRT